MMDHWLAKTLTARRWGRTTNGATRRLGRGRSAFTLLEMLLVVMLIGILMAGGAIAYASYVERGRKTSTMNTLRLVKQALEDWASQPNNGGQYPQTLTELVPQFLEPQSLKDGWNREFVYFPNQVPPGDTTVRPFTLYSRGKSGQNNAPDNIDAWNPTGATGASASN